VNGRNSYVSPECNDIESLILKEKSIAGINAYERIGSCTVGIKVDERRFEMSLEEISRKLSAYGWEKKVITLC
jgi:hypothetical protein